MSIVFIRFLQSYLLSRKSLVVFINFLRPNLPSRESSTVSINFLQPCLSSHKIEQFLSISLLSVPKTSTGFTNFSHPYLSDQNFSTAFINFLQPYLSDRKNPAVFIIFYNCIYQFTKPHQFLSLTYTPNYPFSFY